MYMQVGGCPALTHQINQKTILNKHEIYTVKQNNLPSLCMDFHTLKENNLKKTTTQQGITLGFFFTRKFKC